MIGKRAVLRLATLALLAAPAACNSVDATAINRSSVAPLPSKYAAIVVDASNGSTLYQAASNDTRFPASLTKMMTLYMMFEAIDSGRAAKDTSIAMSAHCASQAPSKLGLKPGQTIDVDTAIRAVAVKSANDIACAVGEFVSGSEPAFAQAMTAKARELGMNGTTFRNASGLHDPAQRTTARDMAALGMRLRRDFPHHFGYFAQRSFTWNGRFVRGHNRALDMIPGATGIKTGYTKASGFNLVTSVERNGKLMVGVILGEDSAKVRDARMTEMMNRYMARQ
ncbi:MAG: D-alanyl-D-alanine carboxypeptidase [Phyllobacteriaceae bacterium]|nr:D-alanyl-D-alanine carboxypeptidase [Phyllobacteriaceae bacterium]